MTTPSSTTGQNDESQNPYAAEAKERWGHTDAYKQSQERVKKMTKEDFARIGAEADLLQKKLVALKDRDPADPAVQALIAEHYNALRHFYEPNLEMYRGLGNMYVDDARFTAHYEQYGPGTAVFLRAAMHAFCDLQESKKRSAGPEDGARMTA
jgi:hypothetical protein